jgi:hypothetical protein
MTIISVLEETRKGSQLLGGTPELTRTFVVTFSTPKSASEIAAACGATLGSPHPDFPSAVVVNVSVDESRIENPAEDENNQRREEAQAETPLPLPPDVILVSEVPILVSEEEAEE